MSRGRWTKNLHMRRAALLTAGVAAVALTAGCGGNTTSGSGQPSGSTAPSSTTGAPKTTTGSNSGAPTTSGAQVTVTDAAAKQLCELIQPQLSDWRVQGPTLGKISLNGTVHEWALRNGGINVQVLGDKAVVDRVMIAQCPDTHTEAIQALELPDLASGLAF